MIICVSRITLGGVASLSEVYERTLVRTTPAARTRSSFHTPGTTP
jgi:hypothetical protein